MTTPDRPYHGPHDPKDLSDGGLRTESFLAEARWTHRIDLSAGNVTVTFPLERQRGNSRGAMMGVIVETGHETNRVTFAAGDQTLGFDPADFMIGRNDGDRPEFLLFQKLGSVWQVISDGRRAPTWAEFAALQAEVDAL